MSLDINLIATQPTTVADFNITHNLAAMADAAGVYKHLWRPEELEITLAGQLIEPLQKALIRLEAEPEYFKTYNPENGWGNYTGFKTFVFQYLQNCIAYPEAVIHVSR
jgi:hypothetical protein